MKNWGFGVCAAFAFCFASAQDTHYWTYQFGTRAALLGGAVVGGTPDNSMLYYNPAGIAFIDSNSFSINANAYQAENTRIRNILTEEKDFSSLQLNSVPLLTSGQFKTKINDLRVSYGIFSPVVFQFRGQACIEGPYAVVNDAESPGLELFVGDQNLFSRLRELNVAVGVSLKLTDRWSIGLTNIVDVRTHIFNRAVFSYHLLNNSAKTLVSTSLTQSFNYYNARYIPKLGIAFRGARWSWGAAFTAPGIRVLGNGAVGYDVLATNVRAGSAERSTLIANGRQIGVKSHFKSPFSVAGGVQLEQGTNRFSASAEYFTGQKAYAILRGTAPPFVQPGTATNVLQTAALVQVKAAARPVLNIALGWEHALNETMTLAASFRNNQSYFDVQLLNENSIVPDITTWDVYHATGGITKRKERSSISLGLTFGFGSDRKRTDQYLPLPSETLFFKNPMTVTKATYTSLGLLVGYNYFFGKE